MKAGYALETVRLPAQKSLGGYLQGKLAAANSCRLGCACGDRLLSGVEQMSYVRKVYRPVLGDRSWHGCDIGLAKFVIRRENWHVVIFRAGIVEAVAQI